MNKKYIIIAISIIVILAVLFGIYKVVSSYLFEDGEITDAKLELVNHIKGLDNIEERKKQIDYSISQNLLTEQEAKDLY